MAAEAEAAAGRAQWIPETQHETPGRLRVRILAVRGDAGAARRAAAAAQACEGVRLATANPATGSLLVEYDPAMPSRRLHEMLRASLARSVPPRKRTARARSGARAATTAAAADTDRSRQDPA